MFDHIGIDVRDLEKSRVFFEAALAPLDITLMRDLKEYHTIGFGDDRPKLWITKGNPTNGEDEIHVCFSAKNRKQVDEFYHAALKAGGRDNGKPGLRPEYHENYYGAFVLDPDGNNIEACCHN